MGKGSEVQLPGIRFCISDLRKVLNVRKNLAIEHIFSHQTHNNFELSCYFQKNPMCFYCFGGHFLCVLRTLVTLLLQIIILY